MNPCFAPVVTSDVVDASSWLVGSFKASLIDCTSHKKRHEYVIVASVSRLSAAIATVDCFLIIVLPPAPQRES